MGLVWRRRKQLGRTGAVNVSNRGISASKRAGRVSVSSRGRGSVRLGKGLSFRFKL